MPATIGEPPEPGIRPRAYARRARVRSRAYPSGPTGGAGGYGAVSQTAW
jgi:hypothetical protein